MGSSAFIFMEESKFNTEKMLGDSIISVFNADAKLFFDNYKKIKNNQFIYTTLTISDNELGSENNHQFIFYIDGKDNYEIYYENDEEIQGLEVNKELVQVGCIEDVFDNYHLVYRFIYEFLKLNPEAYFWVEGNDWVFKLKDLEEMNYSYLKSDWYYQKPIESN